MKGNSLFLLLVLPLLMVGVLAGCTSYGVGFDDPMGEVTLAGNLHEGCNGGRAFFFGSARNTGDLTVENLEAVVTVLNAAGAPIDQVVVFVVKDVSTFGGELVIDNTLLVEESGSFQAQTSVGCGAAVRIDIAFNFTSSEFEDF